MMPSFPPYSDDGFDAWRHRLATLPPVGVRIRRAQPTERDGQLMQWIQAECVELFIQSVKENVSKITKQFVFLAEMDDCPVGLCIASVGRYAPEHLFIQRVGVVPQARRQGTGIALLVAAANEEPGKNIAGATAAEDKPAQALHRKLAAHLGSDLRNVRRGTFKPTDLGIVRGESHVPWVIDHVSVEAHREGGAARWTPLEAHDARVAGTPQTLFAEENSPAVGRIKTLLPGRGPWCSTRRDPRGISATSAVRALQGVWNTPPTRLAPQ